jgi:hypothetical protein
VSPGVAGIVAGATVTVGGGGAVRVGAGPDGGDDPEPPQASAKSTKNTTPIVSVDLIAAGMGIFTLALTLSSKERKHGGSAT